MSSSSRFACSSDRPLPSGTEIVVIGGGITGVTTALSLAEWNVPVILCEKGRIAGEQSSRNWGWIRKQGRDLREMPLMLEAQARWRDLGSRLSVDIGLRQNGITYVADSDALMVKHLKWREKARIFQLDTRVLSSIETDTLLGQSDRQFVGAITTPSDMHAEPRLAVPAMADLAAAEGVGIFEETAVRGLELENGRVRSVVTEHGAIACQAAVLAGGAWCRPFLENSGASLTQLAIRSSAQRTTPGPSFVNAPVGLPKASIRPRTDGCFTIGRAGAARFDLVPAAFSQFIRFLPTLRMNWRIMKIHLGAEFFGALGYHRWGVDQFSPMEQARALDPLPDEAILDDTLAAARRLYPQLASVQSAERWGGMIDVTPDELPLIGEVPNIEGLVVAAGLSGHGFGLGPGVGLLASQLVTGRQPVVDPAAFDLNRFHT